MTVLERQGLRHAHGTMRPAVQVARPWPTLVVGLPGHLDETNSVRVQADLIAAAERRPAVLIADMTRTRSCDWAGAGALASAFGRANAVGVRLRLVLTDVSVRRVLSLNGLDLLMPVYPDVAAAAGP